MIHEFFPDREESAKVDMQLRIILTIIAYEANYRFYNSTISIMVDREPDWDKRSEDTTSKIRGHLAKKETASEGNFRFRELYESEYGKISDAMEKAIEERAREYAYIALKAYHWIKKGE